MNSTWLKQQLAVSDFTIDRKFFVLFAIDFHHFQLHRNSFCHWPILILPCTKWTIHSNDSVHWPFSLQSVTGQCHVRCVSRKQTQRKASIRTFWSIALFDRMVSAVAAARAAWVQTVIPATAATRSVVIWMREIMNWPPIMVSNCAAIHQSSFQWSNQIHWPM